MNVYTRRLQSDWDAVRRALEGHPLIRIAGTAGNPPQRYHVLYRVKGLEERPDGEVVEKDEHVAEVTLLRSYPRQAPMCRMLTPVFHPNIAPHAVCIGDHWSAGESLVEILVRIGEMLALQSYNIKSPLNGEAARWVEENLNRLPIDPRPLTTSIPAPGLPPQTIRSSPGPQTKHATEFSPITENAEIVFRCPKCKTKLSAEQTHAGLEIFCPTCGTNLRIPRSSSNP